MSLHGKQQFSAPHTTFAWLTSRIFRKDSSSLHIKQAVFHHALLKCLHCLMSWR